MKNPLLLKHFINVNSELVMKGLTTDTIIYRGY